MKYFQAGTEILPPSPLPMTNAEAALAIARALGPVLPLCYIEDGVCACGGTWDDKAKVMVPHTEHDLGKAPIGKLVKTGWKEATANSATVDRWWRLHPRANVGLALPPAKVAFIDPDSPDALAEAEAEGVEGGMRRDSRNVGFLFKRPKDCPVINISKSADHTDLEIRTDGYAVVWGTHANGDPVRVDLNTPLCDMPGWAVERLNAKAASKAEQNAVRAARRAERAAQGIAGDEPLWQLDDVALERWNGTLYEVDSLGNLDRSRSLYHLGIDLANHGATEAGIRWAVENRDAALGWRKYTDRDDADTRYDEIAEKVVADGIRRGKPLWQKEPSTGSDGAETCLGCAERDTTIAALGEQLREHKLADQMRRNKAFPAGEVEIGRYYSRQAAAALSQGKIEAPVWGEETERITGQSPATASRFHKAYERLQTDPEIGPTLAWRIKRDVDKDGHEHIKVVVPIVPPDPSERTTGALLAPVARLRRPKDRATHGGARDACPKCQSPMTRTTYDVCQNDTCGHMVTHPSKTVGQGRFHDETEAPPVQIGDDFYAVEVQAPSRFHDEIPGVRTYHEQDEIGSRQPISFVSRDDMEVAAGPRLRLVPDDGPATPTVERPKPWRCDCGCLERYPRQAGGWRCDGCGALGGQFTPSSEWQEVPDGFPCPPGGEFNVNFETGKTYARWPAQEEVAG